VTTPAALPVLHCEKCRDLLDGEDLFCPNCGHEAPARGGEHQPAGRVAVHRFQCGGCGATLTWEIETQGLRCAFCGRATLEEQPPLRIPAPHFVIPFRVDRSRAEAILREWLGRGFFRPGDLRHASEVTEMHGVYLPFWSFAVECDTYWTADSNDTPAFARAAWAPKFGHHVARYQGVMVPASGTLTPREIQGLGPYDVQGAVPYAREVLENHPTEAFAVTRKRARLLAGFGFEDRLKQECAPLIPGTRRRNLKLNPLFTGTTASPVLLPVWIMAYEYGGKIYRFLVNGQTGQADGTAPISPWRMLAAVAGVLLLFALILLLTAR
jgi:hypothetical protein